MKRIAILALTLLLLLSVAACGKKSTKPEQSETQSDPNAVLTDSDVPLDLGAQLDDFGSGDSEVY